MNFQEKCLNYANTLVVGRNEFGRTFGAFTKIPWRLPLNQDSLHEYIKDDDKDTFLFSIDMQKKFESKMIKIL